MKNPSQQSTGFSLRGIARELGIDISLLSRWSHRRGFPVRKAGGYDLQEVTDWRERSIIQRRRPAGAGAAGGAGAGTAAVRLAARSAAPGPSPAIPVPDSALELSRAAVDLVWGAIQKSQKAGDEFSASDMDALKKLLGELRQAEADYRELQQRADDLLPRAEVQSSISECLALLVRLFEAMKDSLATTAAGWLADPAFRAMPDDERRRKVANFVQAKGDELRRGACAELRAALVRKTEARSTYCDAKGQK